MTYQWVDCDRDLVARRYDRLAPFIKLFEWLLWIPAGLRRSAVEALELAPGDRVLEIGCGTGRNLRFLREAVGPSGSVYGVDLSAGMLARRASCATRNGWRNVSLIRSEALVYTAPEPLDGVLFSLSYNTMPHHRAVLQHALSQLRPGGRIVIMDAKLPSGRFGQRILPFSLWLMRRTFLGNPLIQPWEHLAAGDRRLRDAELLFDSYYICRGSKPLSAAAGRCGRGRRCGLAVWRAFIAAPDAARIVRTGTRQGAAMRTIAIGWLLIGLLLRRCRARAARRLSQPAGHLRGAVRARRLDRPDRAHHRRRSSSSGSASRSWSITGRAAAA